MPIYRKIIKKHIMRRISKFYMLVPKEENNPNNLKPQNEETKQPPQKTKTTKLPCTFLWYLLSCPPAIFCRNLLSSSWGGRCHPNSYELQKGPTQQSKHPEWVWCRQMAGNTALRGNPHLCYSCVMLNLKLSVTALERAFRLTVLQGVLMVKKANKILGISGQA